MTTSDEGIQEEFTRAAAGFAERTQGRFDDLGVVEFSQVRADHSVVEIGAGTGNFLALFEGHAARRVALDLTFGMLQQARARHDRLELVQGDGLRLPFKRQTFDLVCSAQAFHHIHRPVPVLMEMRKVLKRGGRILIVDQHATERYEEAAFMNQLEVIRDPSHAVSRPPSAFRVMTQSAGLRIVDEKLWEGRNTFDKWMQPGEFPQERIEQTLDFIERFGVETGMEWERQDDGWSFTRRRIMLLCEPS